MLVDWTCAMLKFFLRSVYEDVGCVMLCDAVWCCVVPRVYRVCMSVVECACWCLLIVGELAARMKMGVSLRLARLGLWHDDLCGSE